MSGRLQIFGPQAAAVTTISAYASLLVADGATPQTVDLAAAKLTGWTTAGMASSIVPSVANSNMVIAVAGVYTGTLNISFSGTANTTFEVHAYLNGAEMTEGLHRKLSGGDVGTASFAIVPQSFGAGDIIDLRANNLEGNGRAITMVDAQFTLFRVA